MSLLNKKIADLTPEDVDALSKPIGIKGRPYPMRKRVVTKHKNGTESMAYRIGLLEETENPLTLYSDRDYAHVLGQAMRNMPTPSMLPLFFDAINRRKVGNKRTIQFLKGAAGAGKTFMSELTGGMRDPRGPIKIDCGQKNLSELLYETVLDFNQDKKFYSELDKRLAGDDVNPLSVQLLKDNLGSAVSEKDGKLLIEWDQIGYGNLSDTKNKKKDIVSSEASVQKALGALREVSRLEGLDNIGGNALGMATQEGPLIKAWKEGREIILDEFNRGKKGSTSSLHGVLQFFAGEINEITVENTLKEKGENENAQKFVFTRADQRAGFFVTLTGNAEEDGEDVDELPQSVSSRIMPQTVPVATLEDWQHRICQIMTGIPVSTIYYSKPDQWDNDPDLFRAKLQEWRVMGLTEDQIAGISPLQTRLLDRWEDVMDASEKLARFYYTWAELTNPDSELYNTGKNSNILMELSDTFFRETTIDFRKIIAHLGEAMEARPQTVMPEESDGYEAGPSDVPPVLIKKEADSNPFRLFGTNLRNVIEKEVIATSLDLNKTALYRQLEQLMRDCGLKDTVLKEGKPSERSSIKSLLDEDPYTNNNPRIQAGLIRDMVCNLWRQQSEDNIAVDNETLLSAKNVQHSMEKLLRPYEADVEVTDEDAKDSDAKERVIFLVNSDADSFSFTPFTNAVLLDSVSSIGFTAEQGGAQHGALPSLTELVSLNDVLVGLTLPRLRDVSLSQLWSSELSSGDMITEELNGIKDEGLALAEGSAESGIKLTSFGIKSANGKDESTLHILYNEASEEMVLIGDTPTVDLKENFNSCAMTYVDRNATNAPQVLKRAIKGLLDDQPGTTATESLLCNAFLLRNTAPSLEDKGDLNLAELMLAKDSACLLPQYIKKAASPK